MGQSCVCSDEANLSPGSLNLKVLEALTCLIYKVSGCEFVLVSAFTSVGGADRVNICMTG